MIQPGEVIGWSSFMTDQQRKTSMLSKDFSTVYEIKKADFLKIIQSNANDYVYLIFFFIFYSFSKEQFCMIKDQINIYKNFENFNGYCSCCLKKTHLVSECPKINYIPDKNFLISKLNFSHEQSRNKNNTYKIKKKFHVKKKFHALNDLLSIQYKVSQFNDKTENLNNISNSEPSNLSNNEEIYPQTPIVPKKIDFNEMLFQENIMVGYIENIYVINIYI